MEEEGNRKEDDNEKVQFNRGVKKFLARLTFITRDMLVW